MKETVAEIDRLIRVQGGEIRSIYLPVDWFARLAREIGISPLPDQFHYCGVLIRSTFGNAITVYLKYRR